MDIAKEFFACLALKHARRIGPRTHKAILDAYPAAYEAVRDASNWQARGLARRDQCDLFLKETWRPEAEYEYKAARMRGLQVLCWGDDRYPDKLRNIPDPPLALYYIGDISLVNNPSLAVVGSRQCTPYGLQLARAISEDLSVRGLTIVSGLARGIDREAHQGGLAGIGSSIAVLGAGLDSDYPVENRDIRKTLEHRGLVLSEFAPGTIPEKNNFPFRNRIISGLSLGVLVAEAATRSGSLITARLAGEQGRDVFALPGPIDRPTSDGCHALLKQGAFLVRNAEEILQELSFSIDMELRSVKTSAAVVSVKTEPRSAQAQPEPLRPVAPPCAPAVELEEEERCILERLDRETKTHIDTLCRALEWEAPKVSQALLMLEMKGLARQWPGMNYTSI